MEEHKVDGEIRVAHLHWVLRTNETDVPTQLGDEPPSLAQVSPVKVSLGVVGRQAKEFQGIDVLELIGAAG